MYAMMDFLLDRNQDIPPEISEMIQHEFKNNADQEFALNFFEQNNRLPDTQELYHA